MSLTRRAMVLVYWAGADIATRQGVSFVVFIVLARFLTPYEFGTIALLYIFTGIATAFVDSGFSTALVQRQDITNTDESTVFWFNLGMSLLVTVILLMIAPFFAKFYDSPVLIPLTAVLALNIVIASIGSIQCTLLTKRLNLKIQMKVGAVASILAGVVAIAMAAGGFGVWALAAQTLVSTVINTVLFWTFSRWRPIRQFSMTSARRLFGFGSYVFAASLVDVGYNYSCLLLTGKIYGIRELGFYDRARNMRDLSFGVLGTILSNVAFPIFSAAAGNPERLRHGMQVAVRDLMFINVPIMFALAVIAEPLIIALLGKQWVSIAPIFRILCMAAVFLPLQILNLNVLLAQGHSNFYLRLEFANKALGSAFLLVGALFGAMGIAWSQLVTNILAFVITAKYTEKYLGYGLMSQVRDFMLTLCVSAIMASMMALINIWLYLSPIANVVLLLVIGSIFFISLNICFQPMALAEVKSLLLLQYARSRPSVIRQNEAN